MQHPGSFPADVPDRLAVILRTKAAEVAALAPRRAELKRAALRRDEFRSFARALERGSDPTSLRLIAEVKRASPSAGLIARGPFEPAEIARRYEEAGADAISVLTDEEFFQGHLDHLREVRAAVDLPVLRKDFVIDEVQIHEAGAVGADAVLLIVAALSPERLRHLLETARACQLDALVEVHTLPELDIALEADADIIGINNRDLRTFTVDLDTTERLAEEVPAGTILISESGIRTVADSRRARAAGADAVLVGEALMRSGPEAVAARVAELKLAAGPGGPSVES